jgi:hypothetical protein
MRKGTSIKFLPETEFSSRTISADGNHFLEFVPQSTEATSKSSAKSFEAQAHFQISTLLALDSGIWMKNTLMSHHKKNNLNAYRFTDFRVNLTKISSYFFLNIYKVQAKTDVVSCSQYPVQNWIELRFG